MPTADVVDPTCAVATGSIKVTAPLGLGYTYSIDGTTFQSSADFTNVTPKSYTLIVKNSAGCTSSSTIVVAEAPGSPSVPTADVVDPTCTVATGSIKVTAPLGLGYTYSIDGTTFQSSADFTNVTPKSYTLIVKNRAGCTSSSTI